MEADLQEGQDFGIYSVKPFNVGVRLRRFEHFIKDARAHDMTKFCFGHVQKIVYCIMPRQYFVHEQKINVLPTGKRRQCLTHGSKLRAEKHDICRAISKSASRNSDFNKKHSGRVCLKGTYVRLCSKSYLI